MRLLLIEDDNALRQGLARQLEADGYRVDQAADGAEGLYFAQEYPVDLAVQAVKLDGEPLDLTAYEYRLLEYLVRERARVVTKQELSDYLYPHGDDRDSNVLEVLVGRLRRKLDPEGSLAPIETLRGRGYRFTLG